MSTDLVRLRTAAWDITITAASAWALAIFLAFANLGPGPAHAGVTVLAVGLFLLGAVGATGAVNAWETYRRHKEADEFLEASYREAYRSREGQNR